MLSEFNPNGAPLSAVVMINGLKMEDVDDYKRRIHCTFLTLDRWSGLGHILNLLYFI